VKQNHNVNGFNTPRCERHVSLTHTASILAKSGHKKYKRRPSTTQKTTFRRPIDGLSQARLPPFTPHFTANKAAAKRKALVYRHLLTRRKTVLSIPEINDFEKIRSQNPHFNIIVRKAVNKP
jgi:uncharacterized RmlC-like cupin family protein